MKVHAVLAKGCRLHAEPSRDIVFMMPAPSYHAAVWKVAEYLQMEGIDVDSFVGYK